MRGGVYVWSHVSYAETFTDVLCLILNCRIKRLFIHYVIVAFINVDKKCGQVLSWNQYLFLLTDLICYYGNIFLDVKTKV